MARPSLFTPARGALIVTTIRETGCSLGAAARVAGIGETTLHDWRKRGAEELEKADALLEFDPAKEPRTFGEFVTALEHALAGMESKLTKCLVDAAAKDWRAAAWWLERRRPEVYGDAKAAAANASKDQKPEQRTIWLVDADEAQALLDKRMQEQQSARGGTS